MVLYPPILKSVISGKVDMVKRCLKEGAALKQVDSCGSSPLIIACMMGYIAIVKFLIEAGVDAESVDFVSNLF
jgi:ankyrin repeat protein